MKSINIQNFRCFKDLHLDFTAGVNLLIGDNACGKTSLLWACKYAVNCFFSGFSSLYTSWISPKKEDFRISIVGEKRLPPKPVSISFDYFPQEMPDLTDKVRIRGIQTLLKKAMKNSRPQRLPLKEMKDYGYYLSQNQIVHSLDNDVEYHQPYEFPLIASFSTHGIHTEQRVNSKYFTEYGQTPDFGYYMCHSTDGLLPYWIRRLLVLKEADKNPTEQKIVTKALSYFFGEDGCGIMSGFDLRVNLKDVVCQLMDGRDIPVSLLSDGYKRLFSIVIDLAFRCALLNSLKFGDRACENTHGTVIIDEIDQHLHPSLQASVLKAFQHTFPNLQFIVSTHAPMVMSGVESNERNQVVLMKFDKDRDSYILESADTYGMDLSTLTNVVLGLPSRDADVDSDLKKLSKMIDDNKMDSAKQLLAELKVSFAGKIPELAGMETEIELEEIFNDTDKKD